MTCISTNINYNMYNTPLSNIFIDNYMPCANPTYTVIYIFFLKNCLCGNKSLNTKEVSYLFKILESDVINALKYWESKNIIKINVCDKENINIDFIIPTYEENNKENIKGNIIDKTYKNEENIKIEEEYKNFNLENNAKHKTILDQKPNYSPTELEVYKNNSSEVKDLFLNAEKILGKLLTSNDLSIIFSFYDWLRLPVDVIELLLENCVSNSYRNLKYIESIAIEWAENNINTKELALENIKMFNRDFRKIMQAFGQNKRNPTKKEIDYMKKWLYSYNIPINIILEACDRTINYAGQPQFSYTDKILYTWSMQKVKTIDDIKNLDDNFRKEQDLKNQNKLKFNNSSYKKDKFVNYDQPKVDFEKLEKLEFEYINNSLKGN